ERWHTLLCARIDGAVVDERAAGCVNEVAVRVVVSGAQLRDLADRAGDRILVALAARLRVIDRPQAVIRFLHNAEDELIGLESARRRLGRRELRDHRALWQESFRVGVIVECGRGFGRMSRLIRIGSGRARALARGEGKVSRRVWVSTFTKSVGRAFSNVSREALVFGGRYVSLVSGRLQSGGLSGGE